MPVFQNISNAHLFLPREDGLKPDIELLPDRTFNGSEDFYNKYVNASPALLQRTTSGFAATTAVTTGPDVLTASVDGFIQNDGIVASAADAALNAQVTAGTSYSAFGLITWTDGVTTNVHTAYFSVIGDGTHGAGSTFSVGAADPVGPAQAPQAAGSVIDNGAGTIAFSFTGANANNTSVAVVYNPSLEGWRARYFVNPLLNGPNFTTIQTVDGSSRVTRKIEYYTGSKVGDPAKVTNYTYTGAQTEPDTIIEELHTLVAADLP